VRRGTERVIRELADGLIARGHEPLLITSHPGETTRNVEDGLRIVRLRRPDDVRWRARGWDRYLAHAPRSLVELVRARADVAHALYPSDAVAASYARRPLVFSYMGLPDAAYLDERRGRRWTMEQACTRADAIVAEELARFTAWLQSRRVVPTIVALRERFENVRQAELRRLEPRLASLPPDARARVDEITHLIVEKLLLTPTEQLKSVGDETAMVSYADAVGRLFALGEADTASDTARPVRMAARNGRAS